MARAKEKEPRDTGPPPAPLPERYVLCPANDWLHAPVAVRLYRSSRASVPMGRCGCRTSIFLPKRQWASDLGLTVERVREIKVAFGQTALQTYEVGEPGLRFVLCPAGGYTHPAGHAVRVEWGEVGKKKVNVARAHCTCGAGVWFGSPKSASRWTNRMGLEESAVLAQGFTISG